MRVLFIGDIFGKPGRQIIKRELPSLISEKNIDIVIANGENLADGRGLTEKTAKELFDVGVDVFTSGNHLWDKKESFDFIKSEQRILKPVNFPPEAIGNEVYFVEKPGHKKLAVFTALGQSFIPNVGYPFLAIDYLLPDIHKETNCIFCDFHAESTAEKRALGFMYDGLLSAIVGTHTHIQTADEEILPNGCAYITDVGMTGPHDSVIGVQKEIILSKMKNGMPNRYKVATDGVQINAVIIDIDEITGKSVKIERIREKFND